LKRSNRLVLLIGVFLAIVAFVGIVLALGNPGGGGQTGAEVPTTGPTVFATRGIALGVPITEDMLRLDEEFPLNRRAATAFSDPSQLLGKTARRPIAENKQLEASDFTTPSGGATLTRDDVVVPEGQRAMAIQVDQVTGVGTVIRAGDYVDLLVALQASNFPVVTVNPDDDTFTVVSGLNSTSVKLLLQGIQVLGTLLPPPPTAEGQAPSDDETGTALTGQQEIVIVSVTPQQAEVIKFAQLDGNVSLILRAPQDFVDDAGNPITPDLAGTTGITLRVLVDEYDILIPQLVEAVLPAQDTP
jgi:pilus assembly protein CpaB